MKPFTMKMIYPVEGLHVRRYQSKIATLGPEVPALLWVSREISADTWQILNYEWFKYSILPRSKSWRGCWKGQHVAYCGIIDHGMPVFEILTEPTCTANRTVACKLFVATCVVFRGFDLKRMCQLCGFTRGLVEELVHQHIMEVSAAQTSSALPCLAYVWHPPNFAFSL